MEKITAIFDKKQQTKSNRIGPECFIIDALSYMNVHNLECVAVTDDEDSLLGLLTEHDIARKFFLPGSLNLNTSVYEIMNTQFPFADINDSIEHCMQLMKDFGTRYLPVFDLKSFKGIISADEILAEVIRVHSDIFDQKEEKSSL
jgi:CBS domain-containing protein